MITIKQAEAIYWIVYLKSFDLAATKLHVSQTAITKRVQEVEKQFDVEIFDRTYRSAQLTPKGKELIEYIENLLETRDELIERISCKSLLTKQFRIGITELTSLTWLPKFIQNIDKSYPRLNVEVTVALTANLHAMLNNNHLDLIITPNKLDACIDLISEKLSSVENVWMCSKQFSLQQDMEQPLKKLTQYTLIVQSHKSGSGASYHNWLSNKKIKFNNMICTDNIITQLGLTMSGLGISYFPKSCFQYLINEDKLKIINTKPSLPPLIYFAFYKQNKISGITPDIVDIAKQSCNYTELVFI